MNTVFAKQDEKDISVEVKLRALHELQTVVSEIDKIKVLRGELPLEVQDLEDEIAGLKTRLINLDSEIKNLDTAINNKKIAIKESQVLIAKYTEQQNNVRNNREFDSLSKEIERSLSTLTERERDIIKLYFGIGISHGLTLDEIGAKFDLTRERVRQIKEKALRRLRNESSELFDYL